MEPTRMPTAAALAFACCTTDSVIIFTDVHALRQGSSTPYVAET